MEEMYFINCEIQMESLVCGDRKAADKVFQRMKKRIAKLSPEIYANFKAKVTIINEYSELVYEEEINE